MRSVGIIPARAGFTRPTRGQRPSRADHPRSRGVYGQRWCRQGPDRGSSPLARGLHRPAWGEGHPVRIIPARAGFTAVRPSEGLTGRDHPRSRGVYLRSVADPRGTRGSSPLARGLPAAHLAAASARSDHPRSRGVYGNDGNGYYGSGGSSPLARGLRRPGFSWLTVTGIIPARAGFTPRRCSCSARTSDHPRSRGVYMEGSPRLYSGTGSSPLARGLPSHPHSQRHRRRIIPARAGFTPTWRPSESPPTDHPRSRGVYVPRTVEGDGSDRIIPARAGFTRSPRVTSSAARDHPRSRGVYGQRWALITTIAGSSPLARGLPRRSSERMSSMGIIPARAGFTPTVTTHTRYRRDHPRSRGVYVPKVVCPWQRPGSSPLARGLPRGGTRWPAGRPDHPRSRGVYPRPRRRGSSSWGSSPLARGLHRIARMSANGIGIIPARAGFTLLGPGLRRPGPDHPRSRGVYE